MYGEKMAEIFRLFFWDLASFELESEICLDSQNTWPENLLFRRIIPVFVSAKTSALFGSFSPFLRQACLTVRTKIIYQQITRN